MKKLFLNKFFPTSFAAKIKNKTYGTTQANGETLHEYWKCFKHVCNSFPYQHIFLDALDLVLL